MNTVPLGKCKNLNSFFFLLLGALCHKFHYKHVSNKQGSEKWWEENLAESVFYTFLCIIFKQYLYIIITLEAKCRSKRAESHTHTHTRTHNYTYGSSTVASFCVSCVFSWICSALEGLTVRLYACIECNDISPLFLNTVQDTRISSTLLCTQVCVRVAPQGASCKHALLPINLIRAPSTPEPNSDALPNTHIHK